MGKGTQNPADRERKAQRKQELKRNKKQRELSKEVRDMRRDPSKVREELARLEALEKSGKLDNQMRPIKQRLADVYFQQLTTKYEAEYKTKAEIEAAIAAAKESTATASTTTAITTETSAATAQIGPTAVKTTGEDLPPGIEPVVAAPSLLAPPPGVLGGVQAPFAMVPPVWPIAPIVPVVPVMPVAVVPILGSAAPSVPQVKAPQPQTQPQLSRTVISSGPVITAKPVPRAVGSVSSSDEPATSGPMPTCLRVRRQQTSAGPVPRSVAISKPPTAAKKAAMTPDAQTQQH